MIAPGHASLEKPDAGDLVRRRRLPAVVRLIATALMVGAVCTCVARTSIVRGSSMEGTLHDGDVVIIDLLPQTLARLGEECPAFARPVSRGDVVVLRSPREPGVYLVKRVVAVPGDRVTFDRAGHVFVTREGPFDAADDAAPGAGYQAVRVRDDRLFVVGDNRTDSADSRSFGAVRRGDVIGRVAVRLWPLTSLGVVR